MRFLQNVEALSLCVPCLGHAFLTPLMQQHARTRTHTCVCVRVNELTCSPQLAAPRRRQSDALNIWRSLRWGFASPPPRPSHLRSPPSLSLRLTSPPSLHLLTLCSISISSPLSQHPSILRSARLVLSSSAHPSFCSVYLVLGGTTLAVIMGVTSCVILEVMVDGLVPAALDLLQFSNILY